MDRSWLTGTAGNATHAILCAVGQNLRLLLRAITAFLPLITQTLLTWLRVLCSFWLNPAPLPEPCALTACSMEPPSSHKAIFFSTNYVVARIIDRTLVA